jgi:hypothetical protein
MMTVPATGQLIYLQAPYNDIFENYLGQLPANFNFHDPVISEGQDLSGGATYDLTSYSSFEIVGSCP